MKTFNHILNEIAVQSAQTQEPDSTGVYVAVRFDERSVKKILNYARKIGISQPISKSKLHCTVIASRITKDFTPLKKIDIYPIVKCLKILNKCVVLELDCASLNERHEELRLQYHLMSDFGYYIPHITLSYEPQLIDIDTLNASFVEFEIHAISEYVQPLDFNH